MQGKAITDVMAFLLLSTADTIHEFGKNFVAIITYLCASPA
jgi:hypothetical protein